MLKTEATDLGEIKTRGKVTVLGCSGLALKKLKKSHSQKTETN